MNQKPLRIGSLCTGYGGLDLAVMEVFGGRLAWCADNNKHVSIILAERYPNVPNLGDLSIIDWQEVVPVDIICAGFPCQDISYSGRGAGIEKGARSGIWKHIVTGIRLLQPKLIVVENVAALLRRGIDRVLGDLAENGYYAVWTSLRAHDIGAPHRRERVFILAYQPEAIDLLTATYTHSQRRPGRPGTGGTASWGPPGGPVRSDALAVPIAFMSGGSRVQSTNDPAWGRYGEAIRRWEAVTGRPAPHPTEPGTRGQPRLSPRFSEWLMGLPKGFVTDLDLPYGSQHQVLGNGVVPQQATTALRLLVGLAIQVEQEQASG